MPLLVYTVLRTALLGAVLLGLWVAGLRGWLLVVVGVLVALAASYVLLQRPRDAAARWLAERSRARQASGARFSAAVEADADAEDREAAALDRTERDQPPR